MTSTRTTPTRQRLVLHADTAADLMAANPVSISADASIREALEFFTERGYSVAPVIDEAGRPIGVLSQADLLIHDRESVRAPAPDSGEEPPTTAAGRRLPEGLSIEVVDPTVVRDIMTPVVFSVSPETPAWVAVQKLLELSVHHLFVVDHDRSLIGVIGATDVLRHLRPE